MKDSTALYSVKHLSKAKVLLLGMQHTFAMFGATVLVPLLTGLDIQTTLLMAGLGTLLFHLITGGQVPAFLGSSFAYLGGYAAVAPMVDGVADPVKLAYAGGGVAVSGLVYLLLAGFIRLYGVTRVMRFFPPVVTGPIIISIGLILAPTAIRNASHDWLLAVIAAGIIVICNIWGKGMIKIIPIILGVFGAYLIALILGRVDFTPILNADIVGLPRFNPARFELSSIITIVPIALATMMEHIGDISAIGATTGINYISKPGLARTLTGDGLATSMSALLGGPANTTYGENTGVLVLTRIFDPIVMRIAAVFAIVLSFFPVLSEGIRTIPLAIIGGVSLILYGMISAIGIRNVVENQVDFTKSRNLIVAAAILVSALGFDAIGGLNFLIGTFEIHLSGLAIAAVLGILLNAVLPGKDYNFSEEQPQPTGVSFDGRTKEGNKETTRS
jgi:uracil permease